MNKETAISKINKYGKIGRIITIIMLIIIGIGTVGTLAAAIAFKVLPKDLININIGTQAEVTINPSALDTNIDSATLETMAQAINQSTIQAGLNMGTVQVALNEVEIVDNTVIARTNEALGNVSLNSVGNALFLVVVLLILTFISVFFGLKLCKAFEKCASPFEENVITRMRNFAFSLLPWALFSSVPTNVINNIFGNNVKMSFSLDANVIFAVLVILALTSVFKYGAILQQESDETL